MPAAVVFEKVPSFGTSLAGELLESHLRRTGYCVATTVLQPNAEEWGELEDRKRWILVATLDKPFSLRIPGRKSSRRLAEYLDEPDSVQDRADAERIARTVDGLRWHRDRHVALGHGFNFAVLDGSESRIPVIPKSYAKINSGPFVQTPWGPRLLRMPEIERIHGIHSGTSDYSVGTQILGQGVLARPMREIFIQIGRFLTQLCRRESGE